MGKYEELVREVTKKDGYYVRIRVADEEKDRDGLVYYSGFKPYKIKRNGKL